MVALRTLLSKFLPHYFVLAEAKLDEGFPNLQFAIDQYDSIEAKIVGGS